MLRGRNFGVLLSLGISSIAAPLQFIFVSAFSSLCPPAFRATDQRLYSSRVFNQAQSDMCDDMKILGVCGGIGSGKSTACKLMVDALGCADRIGELALRNRFFCICKKI